MLGRLVAVAVAGIALPVIAGASELPVPVAELATAPFPAPAPDAQLQAPSTSPAVARLVWIDPTSVALGTEGVVRPEVERLLRAMGVSTSWRRGVPHELARPSELRVIFLDRGAPRAHGAPVLGATPASFKGEPFVWVHVPSVRSAAGITNARSGPSLDIHTTRRLGVALARVIAHEVVHAIAPGLAHGSGLMSPRLDRGMLTGSSIRIDPEVGLAVRAALVGVRAVSEPDAAILAVESTPRESYR
jgi:hypothetical protein